MKPLIVLIVSCILSIIVLKFWKKQVDYQLAGRIAMSAMLIFTAIGHFAFTKGMSAMIPDFFPIKSEIVLATGILEILLAVGLLFPNYRTLTGWILIIFFLLLLPANINASLQNLNYQTGEFDGPGLFYLWFRVPLQVVFIVWVYVSAIITISKPL